MPDIYDITNSGVATKIQNVYDISASGVATQIKRIDDISNTGVANLVYIIPKLLYNRGTVGPEAGSFTNIGGVAGSFTTTNNQLQIQADASSYGNRAAGSSLAFDVTEYNKLRVIATSSGAGNGSNTVKIALSKTRTGDDNAYTPSKGWTINPGGTETEFIWDISAHIGTYYFILRAYNWSASNKVWLRVHEAELLG